MTDQEKVSTRKCFPVIVEKLPNGYWAMCPIIYRHGGARMIWDKCQGIKVREMMRILRKLGYKEVQKGGKRVRLFANDEGNSIPTPFDPEEEMFPKSVWWTLNLIRLPDKEF